MKIAIMMRPIDQPSGFQAFMKGLISALLQMDHNNFYLLLYRTSRFVDLFSSFPNAKSLMLHSPNKLLWDQVAVPYAAWREGADVIYNPKFSVPLVSHCPVVMGLQEPAWWVWPEHYTWLDVRYIKAMLPRYCRKAAHFFPWSQFTIDENQKYLGLHFSNATITYPAPNDYFRPVMERAILREFSQRYQLPRQFILGVTRVDHPGLDGSKSFYPGKNVETTLRAFALIRDQVPHRLVIAGRRVQEYLLRTGWTPADLRNVVFTEFVPHEELPKLYSLADLFVIPSFYESFGFTLVEAMACGCPVVASKSGACPEISDGAGILADPADPVDFAKKIYTIIENESLRQELKSKSLRRAGSFSWEHSAKLTLDAMTQVVAASRR